MDHAADQHVASDEQDKLDEVARPTMENEVATRHVPDHESARTKNAKSPTHQKLLITTADRIGGNEEERKQGDETSGAKEIQNAF